MDSVATNWNQTSLGVSVFADVVDQKLIHYGPHASWSPLSSQQLGAKFEVLRGEIDLGPKADLLARLQSSFLDSRLSPLSFVDVQANCELATQVAEPHSAKISIIQTLPFPKLSFNATINLAEPNAKAISDKLKEDWVSGKALVGGIKFYFDGRSVESSATIALLLRAIHDELGLTMAASSIPESDAHLAIRGHVAKAWNAIYSSRVPFGLPDGNLDQIRSFAGAQIYKSLFREATPFRWEDGSKLPLVELQPREGLAPVAKFGLTRSIPSRSSVEINFS